MRWLHWALRAAKADKLIHREWLPLDELCLLFRGLHQTAVLSVRKLANDLSSLPGPSIGRVVACQVVNVCRMRSDFGATLWPHLSHSSQL